MQHHFTLFHCFLKKREGVNGVDVNIIQMETALKICAVVSFSQYTTIQHTVRTWMQSDEVLFLNLFYPSTKCVATIFPLNDFEIIASHSK